jgi:hypothetical protein
VRHCALSLVGEPIMYPYISEFVQYLHARQISSFLVTNAQFPEALRYAAGWLAGCPGSPEKGALERGEFQRRGVVRGVCVGGGGGGHFVPLCPLPAARMHAADDRLRAASSAPPPPPQRRQLPPVTQLYVSVDAGNKRDLQAVDRPLFADFWERYLL